MFDGGKIQYYTNPCYVWWPSRWRGSEMCADAPCKRRETEMRKEIRSRFVCAVPNAVCMQYHYHQRNHRRHFEPLHTQRMEHGPRLFDLLLEAPAPPMAGLPPNCFCVCLCSFIAISRPTAVSTASSNTSCTPDISLLLHSTYMAPIWLATFWPCSAVTGVRPWVLRRSMQDFLLRRSDLRPTRMRGVVGQKWRTSGYHCSHISYFDRRRPAQPHTLSMTFSREFGQSMAKQTNKRSVSG